MEVVQQIFTKVVFFRCFRNSSYPLTLPSYSDRLHNLKLKSSTYRRIVSDLVFCFRIIRLEVKPRASKYWIFMPCYGRTVRLFYIILELKEDFKKVFHSFLFFERVDKWISCLPLQFRPKPAMLVKKLPAINVLNVLEISVVWLQTRSDFRAFLSRHLVHLLAHTVHAHFF